MPRFHRIFNRGFSVILGLTVLLSLAGIIVLPALGPSHAEPAKARTLGNVSTPQQQGRHIGESQRVPGKIFEINAATTTNGGNQ